MASNPLRKSTRRNPSQDPTHDHPHCSPPSPTFPSQTKPSRSIKSTKKHPAMSVSDAARNALIAKALATGHQFAFWREPDDPTRYPISPLLRSAEFANNAQGADQVRVQTSELLAASNRSSKPRRRAASPSSSSSPHGQPQTRAHRRRRDRFLRIRAHAVWHGLPPRTATIARPTTHRILTCGPHPTIKLSAAPTLCAENRFLFASEADNDAAVPQHLQHVGTVDPCENTAAHAHEEGGQLFVCEACIFDAYLHLRRARSELLKSARLPLCGSCTWDVMGKVASLDGCDGCVCPRRPWKGKWLCFECRVEELERVRERLAREEEERRGIVGAGIVGDRMEVAVMGRLCLCGNGLDGGDRAATRCAGCGGVAHAGFR